VISIKKVIKTLEFPGVFLFLEDIFFILLYFFKKYA